MIDKTEGFTAIEILVVVAIIGMLLVVSYPNILNTLETRNLENSARDTLTTLQTARYRAVDTKLNHRVRFAQQDGQWRVFLEREATPGNWVGARGYVTKTISSKLTVTVNLPADQAVVFSSIGLVEGFDSTRNSTTFQSLKLKGQNQPDLRIIQVYGGGSVRYVKSASG